MTKTNEARSATDSELTNLDAYLALRIIDIEAVGVDATPLYDLIGAIRRGWSKTAEGREARAGAARHYDAIARHAARDLERAAYALAVSGRRPSLWTAA